MKFLSWGGGVFYFINQRLCQTSGKQDVIFGGFIMMFVGDFQRFTLVGYIPLYEEGGDGNILFVYIEYVLKLFGSHRNHK